MKTASAIALAALPALLLSSCVGTTPTSKTSVTKLPAIQTEADGYTYIRPQSNIKLGQLYRSVVPLSRNRLPELTTFCDADFRETKALSAMQTKYASALETGEENVMRDETADSKLGVDGVRFSWLTIGAHVAPGSTTKVALTGVTSTAMEDADENVVWQHLGANCKDLISKRKKAGYAVYIPTRLYKAADVNISTEVRTEVEANVGIPIVPGIKKLTPTGTGQHNKTSTYTLTGKNKYFKLLSDDIPAQ